MTKIDLYDITGKKSPSLVVSGEVFGAKINAVLLAQAARVYLANQRCAKAQTKRRGAVQGSGKKIWRQKGTGRARHGDRYAPIFVGGGKAHGPTGEENYQLKMTKKMKRQALFSALTSKLKDGDVCAVSGLQKAALKTRKMEAVFQKLAGANQWTFPKDKITLVLPTVLEKVIRAVRNLRQVETKQVANLNSYEVLNAGRIVFMEESLEVLQELLLKKGKKNESK